MNCKWKDRTVNVLKTIVNPALLFYILTMRRRWILYYAMIIVAGKFQWVFSQPQPESKFPPAIFSNPSDTLLLPYMDSPPVIDGSANDWEELPNYFFHDNDYLAWLQNTVVYKFGWDEQYLYAMVNVNDNHLCTVLENEDTIGIHLNDAIEFWIDAKNDSKEKIDANDFHFISDILNRTVLFRGDKTLMELSPEPKDVPQSAGITPIVYKDIVRAYGTVNSTNDIDTGFILEMAIPWPAIGVEPIEGALVKLDLCLDDQDSALISKNFERTDTVRDKVFLTKYHFVNWSGDHDFGYPSRWRTAKLVGAPNLMTALSKQYPKFWLLAFLLTTFSSFSVIGWMAYRLYKFKRMPARHDFEKGSTGKIVLAAIYETTSVSHQQKITTQARTYIEQNIDKPLSSEILAEHLAMSVRQLQRIVKEEMKSTPTNFIHIIRLEKAAAMLKNKEGNVTEIAYAVGFNDSSHFSRLFKQYYGISPSHYTQQREG
ncbi:MAG: helix-turn-helix domain-containing protein [Bacteroidetes bacterium]|nr:MAG: helix-turn-helix domain-containing protein [Bacteroidota bacterium]